MSRGADDEGVPPHRRAIDLAKSKATSAVLSIERELELARRQHGLSLTDLGTAVGMSRWQVGRMCAGRDRDLTIEEATVLAAALGLELSVRAFPMGSPIRDVAHLALLERLRGAIHPTLRWRPEVPVAGGGDLRAWDAQVLGSDWVFGVEAETRIADIQALERRVALKARDGRVDGVVLLLADTRHHAEALALAGPAIYEQFPCSGRRAIELLRAGARPPGSAIIRLPIPRRSTGDSGSPPTAGPMRR